MAAITQAVISARESGEPLLAASKLIAAFATNPESAHRAVRFLHFERQTPEERAEGRTLHRNGRGFCAKTAARGADIAGRALLDAEAADQAVELATKFSGQLVETATDAEIASILEGNAMSRETLAGARASRLKRRRTEAPTHNKEGLDLSDEQEEGDAKGFIVDDDDEDDYEPKERDGRARSATPRSDTDPDAPARGIVAGAMGLTGPGVAALSAMAVDLVGDALARAGFDPAAPRVDAAALLADIGPRAGSGPLRLRLFDVHLALASVHARRAPATGDEVLVLWPDEGDWYRGKVLECMRGSLLVRYDDGEVHWERDRLRWCYVARAA